MKILYINLLVFLTSCTYTINLVHSNGTASDVIDETATPTANTSIEVPVKAI